MSVILSTQPFVEFPDVPLALWATGAAWTAMMTVPAPRTALAVAASRASARRTVKTARPRPASPWPAEFFPSSSRFGTLRGRHLCLLGGCRSFCLLPGNFESAHHWFGIFVHGSGTNWHYQERSRDYCQSCLSFHGVSSFIVLLTSGFVKPDPPSARFKT
jgi:hypothetical protein